MGFEDGPSFLCKDPIVLANCVHASRATVCGWEQWGAMRMVPCGPQAFLNYPGTGWTVHLGHRECWRGLAGWEEPSDLADRLGLTWLLRALYPPVSAGRTAGKSPKWKVQQRLHSCSHILAIQDTAGSGWHTEMLTLLGSQVFWQLRAAGLLPLY